MLITLLQTKDVIFKLSLEEDGVMTTCELASLYTEDFDEVIVLSALWDAEIRNDFFADLSFFIISIGDRK